MRYRFFNSRLEQRHIKKRFLIIAFVVSLSFGVNISALSEQVRAATPTIKPVTFSIAGYVKGCGVMQGGATDGKYLYYACTATDWKSTKIVKVSLDGTTVAESGKFTKADFGHANDMTYNSKLGLLVLGAWEEDGDRQKVQFIDPSTLTIKYTKHLEGNDRRSNAICYNAATDQYSVVGDIFDANLQYQNKTLFSQNDIDNDTGETAGKVKNQGIECDSSYIYTMRVVPGNPWYTIISVYDWSGKNVAMYKIPVDDESENMTIVNGALYMGVNDTGKHVNDYFIKVDGITLGSGMTTGSGNCGEDNVDQFSDWGINLYSRECTCSETNTTGGTMSGDTNFKKIATYLSSRGLNTIAITGILGNWDVESPGLSVFRHEDGQGWEVGGYGLAQWTGDRRTNSNGTGVADNLKKDTRTKEFFAKYYTSGYGAPPGEGGIPEGIPTEVNDAWLQVELDFMLEEFNQKQYDIGGGYTKLLKTTVTYVNNGDDMKTALNGAKTATDAALIFTTIFEKQGALAAIKDGTKEQLLKTVAGRLTQAEKDLPDVEALIGTGGIGNAGCGTAQTASSAVTIDGMTFPLQGADKKYIGDGGGGKGSHLGGGTCPYYWGYDLMMNGSDEAKSAAKSVKVVAITDGTISSKVSIKSYSLGGQPYGWQLGLETSSGELFYYTHMLNKPVVEVGQAVKVGDLLETGVKDVNGEHLHIDESPKGKGRNGAFSKGISRSSCSSAGAGDFVELGPTLEKLWEAME